jgi:hypothetical protein
MSTRYRRKAPRRDFDGQVGALFQGTMVVTQCIQLGEGGALIQSHPQLDAMREGDHLVLSIFLVSIGPVIATARCVYCTEKGQLGLQFVELDTNCKKHIREFVSRRKTIAEIA